MAQRFREPDCATRLKLSSMTVSSLSLLPQYSRHPYLLCFLITAAAGLAGLALSPLGSQFPALPLLLLLAAVLGSTAFGSLRHGLLSALVGSLFANYYLSPEFRHLHVGLRELERTALWLALTGLLAFVLSRIRHSRIEAQKILASISEGFCVFDSDWNFVYINDVGRKILGVSQDKVAGKNLWETFPEVRGTQLERQYRLCARERIAVQFEYFSTRSGHVLQFRAYPSADGISVFFQDISASWEKEMKLRTMLDRMVSAHKAGRTGTWEWNLETNEAFWSSEIPSLHALPPEQFDGTLQTCLKTVHPDDVPLVRARLRTALKSKLDYHSEFRVVHPGGETRWLCSHGQVIEGRKGRVARILGITSDITDRRREEEALRRSEKLAAAAKLAATLAHEMNNPLEALTNLLYLTRQDDGLKRETRELLRLADEQLSRVNYVAKQTLGFYGELTAQTVDVVEAMENTLVMYQSRIAAKQVCIEKKYESDGMVKALAGELRQAFSTLLANAIDASPAGAELILRIQPDTLPDDKRTLAVRIEVEDFGPGIPPAVQPHIFEPFFTTKLYVGTGLGLWITKQIAHKRGGSIEFRSNCEPGKNGTCFSLILPASRGMAEAAEGDNHLLEKEHHCAGVPSS
jgi:PAS domain S-box-containing protein